MRRREGNFTNTSEADGNYSVIKAEDNNCPTTLSLDLPRSLKILHNIYIIKYKINSSF